MIFGGDDTVARRAENFAKKQTLGFFVNVLKHNALFVRSPIFRSVDDSFMENHIKVFHQKRTPVNDF